MGEARAIGIEGELVSTPWFFCGSILSNSAIHIQMPKKDFVCRSLFSLHISANNGCSAILVFRLRQSIVHRTVPHYTKDISSLSYGLPVVQMIRLHCWAMLYPILFCIQDFQTAKNMAVRYRKRCRIDGRWCGGARVSEMTTYLEYHLFGFSAKRQINRLELWHYRFFFRFT